MCGGFSRLRKRHGKVFGTPAFKDKSDRQESCKFLPVAFSMHSGIIRKIHLHGYLYIHNASNESRALSETLLSASELQVFGIFEFCAVRGGSGFPLRCPRL